MTTPIRPSAYPVWTQGNNSQRIQPTGGEQFSGFSQNQRPNPLWHNWLWGIMSDWIAWLDFITSSAVNFVVSAAGHHVAIAANLQNQLDQLDAAVFSLQGMISSPIFFHESPALVSGQTYQLSQPATSVSAIDLRIDGRSLLAGQFTYNAGLMQATITDSTEFPTGTQVVDAFYVTNAGVGGGGGGSNSGALSPVGSAAAPITINPVSGIPTISAARQVIWTVSMGGAQAITANPQIAPGVNVGQELYIYGTSNTNYITISDGNGVRLNGSDNVTLDGSGSALYLIWDGSVWAEAARN